MWQRFYGGGGIIYLVTQVMMMTGGHLRFVGSQDMLQLGTVQYCSGWTSRNFIHVGVGTIHSLHRMLVQLRSGVSLQMR